MTKEKPVPQLLCPLDGKTCETNCPDRYVDQAEGGCLMTDVLKRGGAVIVLDEGTPQKTAPGDSSTESGKT